MPDYVWGRNPILETLRSTRQVKRILIAERQRDAQVITAILQEAERQQVPIETVPRWRLDQLSQGAVHQGCLAVVEARKYATLEQIIDYATQKNEDRQGGSHGCISAGGGERRKRHQPVGTRALRCAD